MVWPPCRSCGHGQKFQPLGGETDLGRNGVRAGLPRSPGRGGGGRLVRPPPGEPSPAARPPRHLVARPGCRVGTGLRIRRARHPPVPPARRPVEDDHGVPGPGPFTFGRGPQCRANEGSRRPHRRSSARSADRLDRRRSREDPVLGHRAEHSRPTDPRSFRAGPDRDRHDRRRARAFGRGPRPASVVVAVARHRQAHRPSRHPQQSQASPTRRSGSRYRSTRWREPS